MKELENKKNEREFTAEEMVEIKEASRELSGKEEEVSNDDYAAMKDAFFADKQ